MTSIVTNNASSSALAVLRDLDRSLRQTQSQVSTGMSVGTAKDNAAYWSIATTMRSDNGSLSAVQDALGLGAAKVDTAYAGMEAAVDVISEVKNRLVSAADTGIDRSKIQQEIEQLQDQLREIANSSSFAGENWLVGTGDRYISHMKGNNQYETLLTLDGGPKKVVGSVQRDPQGNFSVSTIDLDLTTDDVLFARGTVLGVTLDVGIADKEIRTGGVPATDTAGNEKLLKIESYRAEWDAVNDQVFYDGTDYFSRLDGFFVKALNDSGTVDYLNTSMVILGTDISLSDLDVTKLDEYGVSFFGTYARAPDEYAIDVLVSFVDGQLEKATNSAAKLGSLSKRIDLQGDFVSNLRDSLDSGIGRLVDAEMNDAATRLKALQAQQQLAIQSLQIANSDAQNVMQLFR
ncbi:flagellin [Neorhizobium sp. T25_27]|uniref:flagellin N-terminal helical domain-containing protein n=1 Tax=Neorhizobium sp. T25_27 TaxID=2093831 RepID=UPI000CF86005|nr:flagellin [Neorhizobium sp. T25_27]